MGFGDADLRIFFRNGDPVSLNGVSTYSDGQPVQANVEENAADANFETVSVSDSKVRAELPYNAFIPPPVSGNYFQVLSGRLAGTYIIRSVDPVDDGSTIQLTLRQP